MADNPPSPVTNFAAAPADQQVTLSWTNPVEAYFTGTMIRYKTTGFPTSTTDGTLLIDKANSPSSGDSYTHLNLTNGIAYYYRAFPHNSTSNYNTTPVTVSCAPSFNSLWLSEVFDPYRTPPSPVRATGSLTARIPAPTFSRLWRRVAGARLR